MNRGRTAGDGPAPVSHPSATTRRCHQEDVLSKHAKAPAGGVAARPLPGLALVGPRLAAGVGAAVTAVLGLAGVLVVLQLVGDFGDRWFDLDGERTIPSLWSAGLLTLAGALGVAVAVALRRPAVAVLGAALAFMAVDEFFALHEEVEDATGIDWQTLYLPVFAVVGLLALRVLLVSRRLGERRFVALMSVGAVCWAASQVLEKVEWDGPVRRSGYSVMMVAEELLEMTGSLLFVLAMLSLAGAGAVAARRATRSAAARPAPVLAAPARSAPAAEPGADAETTPLPVVAPLRGRQLSGRN